jgi:hypothetical protein
MAMLWEHPGERQRARVVPALVVPTRARRATALAVWLSEPYEWISANRQTLRTIWSGSVLRYVSFSAAEFGLDDGCCLFFVIITVSFSRCFVGSSP